MWYDGVMKTPRQLERIFKGIANHRRITILLYLDKNPGASLLEISTIFKCSMKTIAEHVRKLIIAGLVNKEYKGGSTQHYPSPYGTKVLNIIKKFK